MEEQDLFETTKSKAGNVVETYIRNRDGSIRAVERKAGMVELYGWVGALCFGLGFWLGFFWNSNKYSR